MKRSVLLPNYSVGEGACPDGCGLQITESLAIRLQAFLFILSRVYQAPVRHRMTGARCLKHNASLVDKKTKKRLSKDSSTHVGGHASDGYYDRQLPSGEWVEIPASELATLAIKSGLFGGVGYKKYIKSGTNHLHLDERDGPLEVW